MTETIEQIASVHLGKTSDGKVSEPYKTPEAVDQKLLVAIPRSLNREQYGIKGTDFRGADVFNCYEISFLSNQGKPVAAIGKIVYDQTSNSIVESKSLKLYLNSFNMATFNTLREAELRIAADLRLLLQTEVTCKLWLAHERIDRQFPIAEAGLYYELDKPFDYSDHRFSHYKEDPALLRGTGDTSAYTQRYHSASLRSNCRVTNQPDWGDIYISILCREQVDPDYLYEYIASFRAENHFHEEVCEVIFKRMYDTFSPSHLNVTCLYTRRGGIDINPTRSLRDDSLLPSALIHPTVALQKTPRQ